MNYIIHYEANTYNQNRAYFASANRYAHTMGVTEADWTEKVADLKAQGYTIKSVYNSIGKRVA